MEQRATEKGLKLSCKIDEKVHEHLIGDPGRLQQTLLNLISNAVKFTDEGGVEINVFHKSGTSDTEGIRFEVIDTGIGIPEEKQTELFSEFTMVDNSFTRNSEGTGLGLAISKRIVEMMDGEIGFKSQPRKGSTFWFEVDLKKDTSETRTRPVCAPRDPVSERKRVSEMHHGMPGRILIAEDNPVNQMVTKAMLEKVGYRVDVASNGSEAIKAVLDLPYDAVLMDLSMPVMDGLEATKQIRALSSEKADIPIIAVTAHAMEKEKEFVFAAGMNDYVSKPVNRDQLLDALDRWTREHPKQELKADLGNRPAAKPIDEVPVLDDQALEQLAEDIDPEMVPDLVSSFLQDARGRIERIAEAIGEDDFETVEMESHTLGSSSATFGAMRLHKLMRNIEHACQQGDNKKVCLLVSEMEPAAEGGFSALEQYVGERAP